MEQAFPLVLNVIAILIAVFGAYQGVARDINREREERQNTERELDHCRTEKSLLQFRITYLEQQLEQQKHVQPASGISIGGTTPTVHIGRDMVGGDKAVRGDSVSEGNSSVGTGKEDEPCN